MVRLSGLKILLSELCGHQLEVDIKWIKKGLQASKLTNCFFYFVWIKKDVNLTLNSFLKSVGHLSRELKLIFETKKCLYIYLLIHIMYAYQVEAININNHIYINE